MTTNKIIINSAVFIYALEYVKKVMVKNPAVPILENFLLSVANGMMKISGNDLQTTLSIKAVWKLKP